MPSPHLPEPGPFHQAGNTLYFESRLPQPNGCFLNASLMCPSKSFILASHSRIPPKDIKFDVNSRELPTLADFIKMGVKITPDKEPFFQIFLDMIRKDYGWVVEGSSLYFRPDPSWGVSPPEQFAIKWDGNEFMLELECSDISRPGSISRTMLHNQDIEKDRLLYLLRHFLPNIVVPEAFIQDIQLNYNYHCPKCDRRMQSGREQKLFFDAISSTGRAMPDITCLDCKIVRVLPESRLAWNPDSYPFLTYSRRVDFK